MTVVMARQIRQRPRNSRSSSGFSKLAGNSLPVADLYGKDTVVREPGMQVCSATELVLIARGLLSHGYSTEPHRLSLLGAYAYTPNPNWRRRRDAGASREPRAGADPGTRTSGAYDVAAELLAKALLRKARRRLEERLGKQR
jgi:hypothetical protein